jgi:hypothetical protein
MNNNNQQNVIDRKRKAKNIENIKDDNKNHKKKKSHKLKNEVVLPEIIKENTYHEYNDMTEIGEKVVKNICEKDPNISDVIIKKLKIQLIETFWHIYDNIPDYIIHNLKDIPLPLKPNPILNGKLYKKEEFHLLNELISQPKNKHSFSPMIMMQIRYTMDRNDSIYILFLEYIYKNVTHILSAIVV